MMRSQLDLSIRRIIAKQDQRPRAASQRRDTRGRFVARKPRRDWRGLLVYTILTLLTAGSAYILYPQARDAVAAYLPQSEALEAPAGYQLTVDVSVAGFVNEAHIAAGSLGECWQMGVALTPDHRQTFSCDAVY
jgi:hypothetical protein